MSNQMTSEILPKELEETRPLSTEESQYKLELENEFASTSSTIILPEIFYIRVVRCVVHNHRIVLSDKLKTMIELLQGILTFRKTYNASEMLSTNLPRNAEFLKCWPSRVYGTDKFGHVIHAERIQELDTVQFLNQFDVGDILQHRCQVMERIEARKATISSSNNIPGPMLKHIYVLDVSKIGCAHMTSKILALIKPIFDMGQFYYPESLYRMYIVNAPFLFRGMWKIVSPWIDPETREKIMVLSLKEFQGRMEEDGLAYKDVPRFLGGENDGELLDDSFIVDRSNSTTTIMNNNSCSSIFKDEKSIAEGYCSSPSGASQVQQVEVAVSAGS